MFKPRNYIHDKKLAEEVECTICYESSQDMVRCSGACHKMFCLKCVSRSRYKEGPCPNRCTPVFEIQPIPGLKFTFDCPFKHRGCHFIAQRVEEFEAHYKSCALMDQKCKKELQQKRNYECPQGHKLTFLTEQIIQKLYGQNNYYYIFMNQSCSLCHEVTLCRSICLKCSTQEKKACFCTKCRVLPCTKTLCPIGHELALRGDFTYTLTCDFCGLSGLIFGDIAYEDLACNFDICYACHQRLQETHHLVPLGNQIEKEVIVIEE